MTTAKKIKKTSTRWRPASFFLFASFFFSIFFFFFLLFFLLFFFFSKESTALSAGWDKTITAGVEGEEEGEEEKKSTKSPSVGLYKSGPSFAYAAMTQRRPRPLISKCAIAADLHRRPPRRPHLHAKKKNKNTRRRPCKTRENQPNPDRFAYIATRSRDDLHTRPLGSERFRPTDFETAARRPKHWKIWSPSIGTNRNRTALICIHNAPSLPTVNQNYNPKESK